MSLNPGNMTTEELSRTQLIEDVRQHQFELIQQNEELRRTQAELNDLTRSYRSLWDEAPLGYLTLDRSGVITAANRRASEMLSAAAPIRLGIPLQRFLADQSKLVFRQHLCSAAASDVSGVAELKLNTRGTCPDVWVRMESMSIAGDEIRSALIDISQQKAAETKQQDLANQLRQSQKIAIMNELSAGIAHDFNNILQIVVGCADLALVQMEKANLGTDCIDALLDGANRGADLTRRLLAFNRQSSLEATIADLRTVVQNTVELARRTLSEDFRITSKNCDFALPINVDTNLIEQALLNLFVNARNAMPRGGNLSVAVDATEIEETTLHDGTRLAPGRYAAISVSDNGQGIDDAVLPQIFEPFYTTKDQGSGTRLGLAIVDGIVRQYSGGIDVKSSVGDGAIFTIYLPLSENSHRTRV